jgi:membrane-associated phospholipid phosphatase
MKQTCIFFFSFAFSIQINAQADSSTVIIPSVKTISAYKIKPGIDIPITVVVDAWSFYGMSVIYGRDAIPEAEILALNKNNINRFDRPITGNYSLKAKAASDKFFYGSMPLPLFLLLDKKIRKDGLKVGLLFLETMGTTGVLYTTSAMIANRFRPYAYNTDVPMDIRTRGGVKNSFYAGHPSLVATTTFFMASVITHYHPIMKHKWILYTIAGGVTATTGLLRIQAGQHFKTDVITGTVIGTLVGILVPRIHNSKTYKASRLSLVPNFKNGASGFTAYYKLGN